MGSPKALSPLEFCVVDVDGDDRARSGNPSSLDRSVANTTATKYRNRIAPLHIAGVERSAETGHNSTADQARNLRLHIGVDLGALPGMNERLLRERTNTERRRKFDAVESHLLSGVVSVETDLGVATLAGPALAANRSPIQNYEVARGHIGDTLAHSFDHAGSFMAEEKGKLIVDPTFAVVQIRMANAAGLDPHQGFAGTRVRDVDLDNLDRSAFFAGDHCFDLV